MNVPLPMGQKENLHLEFKGRECLKEPAKIAREVVGMLNADGGEVWVGIAEKDGLAAEIEPIEDAELTRQKLRDHLLDTIEPPTLPGEVQIELVPLADGRAVLRVTVKSGGSKPYAQLYKRMRTYVVRVEDRIRHMAREEISNDFRNERKASLARRNETLNAVEQRRAEVQKTLRAILWVYIQPAFEISINPVSNKSAVEPFLRDPSLTNNRSIGWNFLSDQDPSPRSKGDRLCFGNVDSRYVEITKGGGIEFLVPLPYLYWKQESLHALEWVRDSSGVIQMREPSPQIWPHALLEYPTSLFRLAKELYAKFGNQISPSSEVVASLALTGVKGWTLKPGSPSSFHFALAARPYEETDDLVVEPVVIEWHEFFQYPDWGAFRLIRQVYEAFGLSEEEIPPEFRRNTRTLVLPS